MQLILNNLNETCNNGGTHSLTSTTTTINLQNNNNNNVDNLDTITTNSDSTIVIDNVDDQVIIDGCINPGFEDIEKDKNDNLIILEDDNFNKSDSIKTKSTAEDQQDQNFDLENQNQNQKIIKMDEKMYALGNGLAPIPEDFSTKIEKSFKKKNASSILQQEKQPYQIQTPCMVFKQMLIPFLIAGIGSVFAGVVLNAVTQWPVFLNIPQISIMVSAFLGLIGNIETTLASRLSTQANLGRLDTWLGTRDILFGNIMVVQCQASTVGLFAAICSLLISTIRQETREKISIDSILLLCSTSITTSIIANTLIATMIIIVILIARRLRINPDNISTPVAASMGDVCTISILAYVSQLLYDLPNSRFLQIFLIITCLGLAPVFGFFARQNRWTKSVIYTGWTAILCAVIIEQPGGVVMESAFHQYKVMSTFQPLVNGIGSNLVGIQTSRMSTFLHASAPKGQLPPTNPNYCVSPLFVFFSKDLHAQMARLLMIVIIPAHLFYMTIIYLLQDTFGFSIIITLPFLSVYTAAIVLQLALLLYLAYVSVFYAWKHRINPDNSAIPFTSALADVFGNCLMALAFTYLKSINDANVTLIDLDGDNTDNNISDFNSTTIPSMMMIQPINQLLKNATNLLL